MTSERLRELVREMRRNTVRRTDREIQAWANELDGLLVDMELWPWPRLRDNGKLNRWHEYEHDDETGSCVICGWVRQVHTEHEIGASAKCPPCVALDWPEESVAVSKAHIQLLAWAVTNCHTLARRALARTTSVYDREKWEHVLRICEKAGARSAGVLRASLPTEITEGESTAPAAPPVEGRPEQITRFVLVDEDGRICDRWNHHVELVYQDEGRTLKVFLTRRAALTDQGRRP